MDISLEINGDFTNGGPFGELMSGSYDEPWRSCDARHGMHGKNSVG